MTRNTTTPTLLTLTLITVLALAPSAGAEITPNPCGAKGGNPCAIKAENPCGAKTGNPCAGKAANPCGAKAGVTTGMPAVNPCFAKLGTVFMIADPMNRNTVTFRSEAPLEDIVGTSNEITGYLVFDPRDPKKSGKGEIVVPVSSLRTGIPLRDEHLREEAWLDATHHSTISYTIERIERVEQVKKGDGYTTWQLAVEGPLTVRGKSRTIRTEVTLTYMRESDRTKARMAGNLLAARTTFDVSLADFGIDGFEGVVGTKVGEDIHIDVSLVASDAHGNAQPGAGNPCSGKSSR